MGRLPPARLGALCSAALLDNDGLVDVLRREQRLDVVVVVALVVIVVLCVLGTGERARQVRAEVTSERDARAQRDILLADMMADALVTSALNPYWLWSSVGPPPA